MSEPKSAQLLFDDVADRLRLASLSRKIAAQPGSAAAIKRMRRGLAPRRGPDLLWTIRKLKPRDRIRVLAPVLGNEAADILAALTDLQSSLAEGRHALNRINALIGGSAAADQGAEGLLRELAADRLAGPEAVRAAGTMRDEGAGGPPGICALERAPAVERSEDFFDAPLIPHRAEPRAVDRIGAVAPDGTELVLAPFERMAA